MHNYTCQKANFDFLFSVLHSSPLAMPGRPKSALAKAVDRRKLHDSLMLRAVELHKAEQKKPQKERLGLRKICDTISQEHYRDTGDIIKLSHMTLSRLAAGGTTQARANAERGWLLDSEVDVVIEVITDLAERGFPITHKRLKEVVDTICFARLGDKFPAEGVGINWTYRFAVKNKDRIKISRSRPLEDKRGRAANPYNNEAWYKLLEETLKKYNIKPENMYGSDEVGVQLRGQGERHYVFGPRTKAAPRELTGGTRENVTVICTICADGTSVPPGIIFKGQAYNIKWAGNNPLDAS